MLVSVCNFIKTFCELFNFMICLLLFQASCVEGWFTRMQKEESNMRNDKIYSLKKK